MIELRGVTVELGGKPVVDGVTAAVADGEWLGLIGPNGAGKTTLLRAIARLVPFTGAIALGGRLVEALPRRARASRRRRTAGAVDAAWMTVAEYVLLGRTPHLGPLAREGTRDREAAARSLARLDLPALRGSPPRNAVRWREAARRRRARSPRRRRSFCSTNRPPRSISVISSRLDLLDGLREESGLTLVAAMHDLTLAAQYADRMLLLDAGRVVADGSPADVLTRPRSRSTTVLRSTSCPSATGSRSSHGGRLDLPERRLAA